MNRTRLWTVLLAAAVLEFQLGAVAAPANAIKSASSVSPTELLVTGSDGGLKMSSPSSAVAGTKVTIDVTGATDGIAVSLVGIGSLGTSSFTTVSSAGTARFDLPVDFTRTSGSVSLLAAAGPLTAHAALELVPGRAAFPVQSVVGARSIVADGRDLSMVVTIPIDSWGNAVADGTGVRVSRSSPTGAPSSSEVVISHLLAWQELPSGTAAGRGYVWAATQGRTGPQVSLDEVAGPPLPFTLATVDPALAGHTGADGQTLIRVRTSLLRDRYGNVEPDGTSVMMKWVGPASSSQAEATTVAGVAEVSVQVPSTPQTFTLTAQCRGTDTTSPLRLAFAAVVTDVPLVVHRSPPNLSVTIGPINRNTGNFVPDGTTATVVALDGQGHRVSGTGELVDGGVTVLMPSDGLVGAVTVTADVLGTSRSISVR